MPAKHVDSTRRRSLAVALIGVLLAVAAPFATAATAKLYVAMTTGSEQPLDEQYHLTEYFDTLRECKAAAQDYAAIHRDDGKRKPDGTLVRLHYRCVPDGASAGAVSDTARSHRLERRAPK
jgi:hypothetical protein